MAAEDKTHAGFTLRRWAQRKRETRSATGSDTAAAETVPAPPAGETPAAAPQIAAPPAPDPAPLPPIESLTPQSDFVPFMRPDVDPSLKNAALKKLFGDPHFNVMDGLDTYIDDYSKPDPISPEMMKQLLHTRSLFAPTPTRYNEQGFYEDVVEAPAEAPEAPADPAPVPQIAESPAEPLPPPAVADEAIPEQVELPLRDRDAHTE